MQSSKGSAAIAGAILVLTMFSGCARKGPENASTDAAVAAQINRLNAVLRTIEAKLPAGFQPLVPRHRASLTTASRTESAVLRLYRLRDPYVGIEALQFVAAHPAAMKDLSEFEKVWNAERAGFAAVSRARGNALQRALSEAAANRSQVLLRASLPYARTSSPADGLYYLAEAVANRRFASFVATLNDRTSEHAPSRDAVDAALAKVDDEMLAAYEKEPTGKTTIPSSALSKESHELLRRGWVDGAALLLIESRLALTKRAGDAAMLPDTPLQPRSGSFNALLAAMAKESEPTVSRAVRAQVAPMYASLFEATPALKVPAAPVTITLVRWPYT